MHPLGKRCLNWYGIGWAAKAKNGIVFMWGLFATAFLFIMLFAGYEFIFSTQNIFYQIFYDDYLILPEQHHNVVKTSFIIYEIIKHFIWFVLGYIIDLIHKPWWYTVSMVAFISGLIYVMIMYMSEDVFIQTQYEQLNIDNKKK